MTQALQAEFDAEANRQLDFAGRERRVHIGAEAGTRPSRAVGERLHNAFQRNENDFVRSGQRNDEALAVFRTSDPPRVAGAELLVVEEEDFDELASFDVDDEEDVFRDPTARNLARNGEIVTLNRRNEREFAVRRKRHIR